MKDRKLKVVIIVTYTYPYIGSGIGCVAQLQAESLAKLGHEVILVSSNLPRTKKEFKRNGVLYLKLEANDFLERFYLPVPLFLFNSKVIYHIKRADIIHVHDMLYPSSLQGALLARGYRKPLILTQHVGYIKYSSPLIDFLEELIRVTMGRLILRLSQKVIVVNEEVKNWLNVDHQKVVTLINGVDTSLFCPPKPRKKKALREKYNLPLNKKIVFFNGRLVPKKGFVELFEARDSSYLIIFVGAGEVPGYMKEDQKDVLFLGTMPPKKVSEIYQLSDIFVLPSKCEGFPLVIQEAMASGLPTITSHQPGYDQYLDKKYIKYIAPNGQAVKKAIIELLSNKSLMKQMSRDSRGTAITKITWRKNVEGLLAIYREVL